MCQQLCTGARTSPYQRRGHISSNTDPKSKPTTSSTHQLEKLLCVPRLEADLAVSRAQTGVG